MKVLFYCYVLKANLTGIILENFNRENGKDSMETT